MFLFRRSPVQRQEDDASGEWILLLQLKNKKNNSADDPIAKYRSQKGYTYYVHILLPIHRHKAKRKKKNVI